VVIRTGFIWFKVRSILKLRDVKEVSILFSMSFPRTTLLCGGWLILLGIMLLIALRNPHSLPGMYV